jgi:hypothetical protein
MLGNLWTDEFNGTCGEVRELHKKKGFDRLVQLCKIMATPTWHLGLMDIAKQL